MKKQRVTILMICCAVSLSVFSQADKTFSYHSYATQYRKECDKALQFYKTHIEEFEQIATQTSMSAKFLFAIVAPEYTQYSYLSDKLETYSLKVLYVQGGKDYSNFSIGFFQMKPSFIEQMEDSLSIHQMLKAKYQDCLMDNPDSRAARVTRVDRLTQLYWQMRYLSLFSALTKERFSSKQFVSEEEKLRFYAAAYNTGFYKQSTEIEAIAEKALFPHFSSPKYQYGDISWWFYQQCSNIIN